MNHADYRKLKWFKRCILAAIGIVLLVLVFLQTWTLEKQINLRSGELRNRHIAFGVPIYTSDPKENILSLTAKRDGVGYDWLTVSTRSLSRQPCKEDWRTLFTCAGGLIRMASSQEESQAFARCVLEELDECRSISKVTRHAVGVYTSRAVDDPNPAILNAWRSAPKTY